jgi:hypothetical protein
MRILSFALSTGLALIACRSDSGNTVDSNGGGDGTNGGAVTIQMVQNDAMPPATAVSLHNVVVTAIDNYGAKVGDLWVEEVGGGPFSGIHVFKADATQVAALALGDRIDLTGAVKDEFALATDTSGRTVTELKPATGGAITITKLSSGTPLTPDTVNALQIGQMADPARSLEWEKWEGVLITVTNISALGAPKQIGGATPDPTLQSIGITGVAKLESSLSAFPTGIKSGDCLGSATGVVDYFFDYLIMQRATTDITTGGTACPAPESSISLCMDAADNDANGFADCADNACIVAYGPGVGTCRQVTTIPAIQATTPTGGIEIDNAYVVAISSNKKNMWVQTNPTASATNGVYVFGPGADLTYAVGSKVNIIGTVQEFNNDTMGGTLTEVKALDIQQPSATTTPLVAVAGQTAAQLTTAGAMYESVLVTLTNVKMTVIGTTATHGVGSMSQGGAAFETDDDVFLDADAVNTCYSTIKGIWTYQVFDNVYAFLPLAAGTAGGTCP